MRIKQPALFAAPPLTPYRYTLHRWWGPGPCCCWIMLNPNTATEDTDDPTLPPTLHPVLRQGYGHLVVVNLFALRSTNPAALADHADPIGTDNDQAIVTAARHAGIVVCAWGAHPFAVSRARTVGSLLRDVDLHCLGGPPSTSSHATRCTSTPAPH